jgi:hypothetical protein
MAFFFPVTVCFFIAFFIIPELHGGILLKCSTLYMSFDNMWWWVQMNVAGKRTENEGYLILHLFMSTIIVCFSSTFLWMEASLRREREKEAISGIKYLLRNLA